MTRLKAISSLITPCENFADIGTDHGYIARYAAKICKSVVASDISEKCIKKTRKNNKAKNIKFVVGDGLSVLSQPPDIIAICGLGGHTITDILSGYQGGAKLILQPQNDIFHVREFLTNSGFALAQDICVKDKGKFYTVLMAQKGSQKLDNLELHFGRFYKNKNSVLKDYLTTLQKKYSAYNQTDKNTKILEMIDEALVWQK